MNLNSSRNSQSVQSAAGPKKKEVRNSFMTRHSSLIARHFGKSFLAVALCTLALGATSALAQTNPAAFDLSTGAE